MCIHSGAYIDAVDVPDWGLRLASVREDAASVERVSRRFAAVRRSPLPASIRIVVTDASCVQVASRQGSVSARVEDSN